MNFAKGRMDYGRKFPKPKFSYDYDNFLFTDLWQQKVSGQRTLGDFKAWARYAVSDHRPLFVRLKV